MEEAGDAKHASESIYRKLLPRNVKIMFRDLTQSHLPADTSRSPDRTAYPSRTPCCLGRCTHRISCQTFSTDPVKKEYFVRSSLCQARAHSNLCTILCILNIHALASTLIADKSLQTVAIWSCFLTLALALRVLLHRHNDVTERLELLSSREFSLLDGDWLVNLLRRWACRARVGTAATALLDLYAWWKVENCRISFVFRHNADDCFDRRTRRLSHLLTRSTSYEKEKKN